jgi:hypothetical protein
MMAVDHALPFLQHLPSSWSNRAKNKSSFRFDSPDHRCGESTTRRRGAAESVPGDRGGRRRRRPYDGELLLRHRPRRAPDLLPHLRSPLPSRSSPPRGIGEKNELQDRDAHSGLTVAPSDLTPSASRPAWPNPEPKLHGPDMGPSREPN